MQLCCLILAMVIQSAKPAPVPGVPVETGIYYQDGKAWGKLQPATMSEMKAKGVDMFLETDGYSSLNLTIEYQGAESKTQIFTMRPAFYCRGTGSAKDAMIVELSRKKDLRSIRTSSADATSSNRVGFRREAVKSVTVTEYSDGSFSVIPEQELKPGEYLLVFGPANSSFDFGVKKRNP